ncbi:MAG TPA: hypothetical protein VGC93_00360 [Thermoanaerobaculia bacterium]
MKLATGTVVHGKVELPAEFAAEGAQVVVLAPESEVSFELSPAQEQELLEAFQEIERGEFIDGEELLNELRSLPRG